MTEAPDDPTTDESSTEAAESDLVEHDGDLVPASDLELGEQDELVNVAGGKQVIKGPHSRDPPAYENIVIPENKRYEDYNTYERRAILLQRIERAGHPRALGSTYQELSDEFDVAKSTISSDMERLGEYVADNLDRDHHMITDSVFRGAILDLVENGKKAWAAELARDWYEWLADMGEVERVAEDVNLNLREQETETEAYKIVESEPAVAAEAGGALSDEGDE